MAINASNSGKQRELVPAGVHVARCFGMIEVGTIDTEYKGSPKTQTKVIVDWELPEETKVFNPEKGEQPFVISKEYTLSMYEKATLRMDLESWRGQGFTEDEAKEFDITKLIGATCLLNIIHKVGGSGNAYATVSSIMPLPKKTVCPPQVNKTRVLSYDDFDFELFNTLPDFIKDKIKSSKQYQELTQPKVEKLNMMERVAEVVMKSNKELLTDLPF